MSVKTRLKALERATRYTDPATCPGGITIILDWDGVGPKPEVPHDAHRCGRCGQPHVMFLTEVIVAPRDAGAG